jgi:hypothetical protein
MRPRSLVFPMLLTALACGDDTKTTPSDTATTGTDTVTDTVTDTTAEPVDLAGVWEGPQSTTVVVPGLSLQDTCGGVGQLTVDGDANTVALTGICTFTGGLLSFYPGDQAVTGTGTLADGVIAGTVEVAGTSVEFSGAYDEAKQAIVLSWSGDGVVAGQDVSYSGAFVGTPADAP